jgi:Na+/proline symporter
MPIWIGLIALFFALPGAVNASVNLYDRFIANRGQKPSALTGRVGRWGIWVFNLISLALLGVVIAATWLYPPNASLPPTQSTATAAPATIPQLGRTSWLNLYNA